jgi:hypothetical protein
VSGRNNGCGFCPNVRFEDGEFKEDNKKHWMNKAKARELIFLVFLELFIFKFFTLCFKFYIRFVNLKHTCLHRPSLICIKMEFQLQCVHWGRLKSICLFHGPGRSVKVQEGGKILMILGLLINIFYIVPLIFLLFTFYAFS